jgi:hypothetical protein
MFRMSMRAQINQIGLTRIASRKYKCLQMSLMVRVHACLRFTYILNARCVIGSAYVRLSCMVRGSSSFWREDYIEYLNRISQNNCTRKHVRIMHARTRMHTRAHASKHKHMHKHAHARTHIRSHTRMHARTDARTYVRKHACTHACTHAHTHARTHGHKQAPTLAHTHDVQTHDVHTHTRAYVRTQACAHACMHARMYARAHEI